jgi:hypothetical protein
MVIIIALFVLYFIAYSGSRSAAKSTERMKCIENQYYITYQLYVYKRRFHHFPADLNEMLKNEVNQQLISCPVLNRRYLYDQIENGEHFKLRCGFDRNEFYNHVVHPDLSSDDVLSDERLDKSGYNLVFNEASNCKDVSHIRIYPEIFYLVIKDKEHCNYAQINTALVKSRKTLQDKGFSKRVEISGILR